MKRFKELFEQEPGFLKPKPHSFTASAHGKVARNKTEKETPVNEQHREEGRFKPVKPHYVKSVGIGPRPQVDSAHVKLKEDFGKKTPSVEEVANKHGVSVDEINKQLEMGIKVEKEHTNDAKMAREIALDHLNEKPNYYSKLKKYVEMTDVEYQSAGTGARTLVDKPNKEPMKTYKQLKKEEMSNDDKSSVALKALVAKKNLKQSEGKYKSPAFMKKMQDRVKAGEKLKEEVEQIDELSNELLGRYKDKAVISHGEAEKAKNYKLSDKRFSGVVKATNKQFANARKKPFGEEVEPPFVPDKKQTTKVIVGKAGKAMATAKHLARQALKKQVGKMKPMQTVKESRKAEIVKEIAKKKKNDTDKEGFSPNPELSSEITKA